MGATGGTSADHVPSLPPSHAPTLPRSLVLPSCRHSLLHLSSEMRGVTQHALNEHQLATVMHLVLLGRQQHLETRLARGLLAWRHPHFLGKKLIRQIVKKRRPGFPLAREQVNDLRLGA